MGINITIKKFKKKIIKDEFTGSIIQEISGSKSCHCLRDPFGKKDHGVG